MHRPMKRLPIPKSPFACLAAGIVATAALFQPAAVKAADPAAISGTISLYFENDAFAGTVFSPCAVDTLDAARFTRIHLNPYR